MTTTPLFVQHTPEDAPVASRQVLSAAKKRFGMVPNALALLAASPTTLEAFGVFTAAFERSALSPLQREVVIMAVGFRNECEICVAMHTRSLRMLHAEPALIEALRSGESLPDPHLEALRAFTWAVMEHRGAVPERGVQAFLEAGFTREQALDVVLGVGAYTLSTYANRLVGAPLDKFLEPSRWTPPTQAPFGAG